MGMQASGYDAAFMLDGEPRVVKLTVRNLPHGVHRALRARAARRGHSIEAEVRGILLSAVNPLGRVKLGSMLADMGRRAKLSDNEFAVFEQVRGMLAARPPISFQ
jgi:antitoxin FitA